jgi:transcriptional regulator of heat shock response
MVMEILNKREKVVLDLIVESYIASAEPVGSRTISRTPKNR